MKTHLTRRRLTLTMNLSPVSAEIDISSINQIRSDISDNNDEAEGGEVMFIWTISDVIDVSILVIAAVCFLVVWKGSK